MNDDSIVKIMQSLDLDYSKAILSTMHFGQSIEALNKQLAGMKGIAIQTAKDVNTAFASQMGQGNKSLVDQYGNAFRTVQSEAKKTNTTIKDTANTIKQSTLEQLKSQSATIQQRTTTKKLSDEYSVQAKLIRDQANELQNKLMLSGKLTDAELMQTKALREQLDILKHQTAVDVSDQIRINPNPFGDEWQRRAGWFLSGSLFYGVINGAKEATAIIKDVEMGMVELARVMDDSSFVFNDYRDDILRLGVEYGQTFDTVQQIALRWAQSGYNVADSLELTRTALLALNTAELDVSQATEAMIGIMAQWQLQAEDLALVMDKINITADNYSVTSQDLVDGLLRSSGAARIMNLSLDETLGLLTVMREASGRTGREVGNALNSILSYIQRPGSINVLERMGISVFADEARTEFRNVLEIFQDIGAKWNTVSADMQDGFVKSAEDAGLFGEEIASALGSMEEWTDLQQRDLAQASAGVYRRNYFIGLIERLSNVQGVLNNMVDAGGYSMAENEKTMDTLEKKMQSFKTAIESLAVALGDTGLADAFKLIIDAGTALLNVFNALPDYIQKPILAFAAMFAVLKTGQMALKTFGLISNAAAASMNTLATAATATATATTAATTAAKGFMAANQWLLVISLAASAISYLYTTFKNVDEAYKQNIETTRESIKTHQEEIQQLQALSNEYTKLQRDEATNATSKTRLLEVQRELAAAFPELTTGIDAEGNALATNSDKTKELIDSKKQLLEQELLAQSILAEKALPALRRELAQTEEQIAEVTKRLESGDTTVDVTFRRGGQTFTRTKDEAGDLANQLLSLTQNFNKLSGEISAFQNVQQRQAATTNQAKNAIYDYTEATGRMLSAISDVSDDLGKLNQIIHDVRNGQSLSVDTILDLLEKYDLSYDAIRKTSEGYTIEISALENLRKAKIQTALDKIEVEKQDAENVKKQTEIRLRSYGLEIEQLKNVAAVRAQLAQQASQYALMNADAYLNDPLYKDAYSEYLKNAEADVGNALKALSNIDEIEKRSQLLTSLLEDRSYGISSSSSKSSTENKALSEALKQLEHRKKMSEETQESIRAEIAELQRINNAYAKTNDERMNMAERIYAAEKRLMDRRLQDSVNWINEKKALDKLSAEEEIAAWERVLKTQSDNSEAVKQATLNLYKLRSQAATESYTKEESAIQHWAKMGVYSIQQQIEKYKELYSIRKMTTEEQWKLDEQIFGLYKSALSEQQKAIKEAYDERIKQIEAEAKAKKAAQEEVIKGIEKELELLNRQEEEYDHDKKMADLREQLAYWQVRTSEDARKKVADLLKQIDEAEHKREVELQKQGLEEKKKIAQDEIKTIEAAANEEKENWEASYRLIEKSFDDHSTNIVALAATMSKEAYQQWVDNYLTPMQTALSSGSFTDFESYVGGLQDSINNLNSSTGNSLNAQIYRAASQILEYKRQWANGDTAAAQRATQYYNELYSLGAKGSSVANALNSYDYEAAKNYVNTLPQMHSGGKTLSYGAVYMKPGELVFPPNLSTKLESLISLISGKGGSQSTAYNTDRKVIINGNLFNSERTVFEDGTDMSSMSRELQRALAGLT